MNLTHPSKPITLKRLIILSFLLLSQLACKAQPYTPLSLTQKIFSADSFPDLKKYCIDEYQGNPTGHDFLPDARVTCRLLAQNKQIKTIAGCIISAGAVRGAEAYNGVMMQAISQKLGIGWKVGFDKSVDSLYRLQSSEAVRQAVLSYPGVAADVARLDSVPGQEKSHVMVDSLYNDSIRKAYLVIPYGQGRHRIYKKYSVNIYTLKVNEYVN